MPLGAHQPPGTGRMLGDLSRRVGVLEREKNPTIVAVPPGTFPAAVTGPGGLTAWWRLGDTFTPAGTVANAALDSSAFDASSPRNLTYGEDSTAGRPTVHVPNPNLGGDDDGAISFPDNTSSYLYAGVATAVNNVTKFAGGSADSARSCAVWFKTPSAVTTGGSPVIIGQWGMDPGGSFNVGWVLDMASFTLQFSFASASTGVETLSGPSLNALTWYHAAVTYDPATTTWRLYVNGILSVTRVTANTPTYNNGLGRGFAVGFGDYDSGATHRLVYGWGMIIDEVALWKVTLSATQVQALAAGASAAAVGVHLVTSAYTILTTDTLILANGTFTVTLPSAIGIVGQRITVKNIGVGTVTVGRTSSQTIDAAAANTTLATTKQAREFTSDGAGWQITAAYL